MSLHISPSGLGDESGRISNLERALGAIQREADGMSRETIVDAKGQRWEALARRGGFEPILSPFYLSVFKSGEIFKFTVGKELSTVTDGTNGDMIDLANVGLGDDLDLGGKPYVVLRATINDDLEPTYWYLEATDEKKEIIIVNGKQTEARLLIGKVIYENGGAEAIQCINDAQRLCHGFLNGVLVRIFESAPVHPDYEPPKD